MNVSELSLQELIDAFVASGLLVDRTTIEELIKRREVAPFLPILHDDRYWKIRNTASGDGWTPIHSVFMLGMMGNVAAFEAVAYAFRNRVEELGDWITEDGSRILSAFGTDFFDRIREITLDATFDTYVRLAALEALVALSADCHDLNNRTIDTCKVVLRDSDHVLVGLALPVLAEVKDDDLFGFVKSTFHALPFARDVTDMEDLEQLHAGTSSMPVVARCKESLWTHFSKEKLDYLYKINYGSSRKQEKNDDVHALSTVRCSACGNAMECPQSMLTAKNHLCSTCVQQSGDKTLQAAVSEMQHGLDYLAAVGKKLDSLKLREQDIEKLLESADAKHLVEIDADPNTEEGVARLMNALFFGGDWDKQLQWTEKHGRKRDAKLVQQMITDSKMNQGLP
ncbi:MAG: DUF1186 domain-containing protein [Candidatus Aenigmarchaeota archaeon]|nr:DUF1186 domain-containing protein [Candidatus Aenigmarchaeota archaeon]